MRRQCLLIRLWITILIAYSWSIRCCCCCCCTASNHDEETDISFQYYDYSQGRSGLVWHDLVSSSSSQYSALHNGSSGFVPNGHVCGILGPSGAGKSTFLRSLVEEGRAWQYHHDAEQQQQQQLITAPQVAWLQQHDSFFELLTVQETLQLAAFLELPEWTVSKRQALVQTKLKALGLATVAHRRVGNCHATLLSGNQQTLSGGERRRLAVALELLTNKELLLADEPTTGLDASMSIRVVQLIRDTVQSLQIPAFCVLHQPRSVIWNELLDHVLLLASGGRVCYVGPRNEIRAYFEAMGYVCPRDTNPAEFYVDLISVDPEDAVQAAVDERRVQRIVEHFREYQQQQLRLMSNRKQKHHLKQGDAIQKTESSTTTTTATTTQQRHHRILQCPQWLLRFTALLKRSFRQNIRDTTSIGARLVFSMSNAWLLTQLYPTVVRGPATAHSLADRAALLTTAAMIVCNMAYMKTADLLEQEYPVVMREQMRHQYTPLEYLLAKALAELPLDALFAGVFSTVLKLCTGLRIGWWPLTAVFSLLTAAGASLGFLFGSWFAADGLALQAGLPILVVLMLVGVINPSGVDPHRAPPLVAQWMKRISPFASAIHAIMIAEFEGMQFASSSTGPWFRKFKDLPRMGAMAMVQNGNQVLNALGLKHETYARAMKHLACLTGINLLLSWWGLCFRRQTPKKTKTDASSKTRNDSKKPITKILPRVRL